MISGGLVPAEAAATLFAKWLLPGKVRAAGSPWDGRKLGDGAAVHGLRFSMFNVIHDRGEPAFRVADYAVRHFLRRQTLELPDDAMTEYRFQERYRPACG